jgi:hypothetical protein
MSERRIAQLFAATRDRALSVGEIADYAFKLKGQPATRSQLSSAIRAARRLLRRMREDDDDPLCRQLYAEARRNAEAALGYPEPKGTDERSMRRWREFQAKWKSDPAYGRAEEFWAMRRRFGTWDRWTSEGRGKDKCYRVESSEYWRETIGLDGNLYFHAPDVPVRVWAVSITRTGFVWADAEVLRITEQNVTVRYAGEVARLDREKLWRWWAFYRAVRFVSSRTGRVAQAHDEVWQEHYGHAAAGVPPSMQMPLAEAMALLGVSANYIEEELLAAFRREAKKAHPDAGGTAEQFIKLREARDRLLASIGTSAPKPQMPTYAPKGAQIVYRSARLGSRRRLAGSRLRLGRVS